MMELLLHLVWYLYCVRADLLSGSFYIELRKVNNFTHAIKRPLTFVKVC